MDMENATVEELIVYIIANAGDSKSCSFEAIDAAKENDFAYADQLLKQAETALEKSHLAHTALLARETKKELEVSLLMVHASNHLSIAEISQMFAVEIISLHKERT